MVKGNLVPDDTLKKLFKSGGISQTRAAYELGIGKSVLSRWALGWEPVPEEMKLKIAAYLRELGVEVPASWSGGGDKLATLHRKEGDGNHSGQDHRQSGEVDVRHSIIDRGFARESIDNLNRDRVPTCPVFIREEQDVMVEIFMDGACSGNPGPGGWGAIVRENGTIRELSGAEPRTTNNRMELIAVIEALKSLNGAHNVIVTTDSQYVQKGITDWIKDWKMNGWKNAGKKPVKNSDLWRELDAQSQLHQIKWKWLKGHAVNERCYRLAREAISKQRRVN